MLNFKVIVEKSEALQKYPMFKGTGGGVDYFTIHEDENVRAGIKIDLEASLIAGPVGVVRLRVVPAGGKDIFNVEGYYQDTLKKKIPVKIRNTVRRAGDATRVSWVSRELNPLGVVIGPYNANTHESNMKEYDNYFQMIFEPVLGVVTKAFGKVAAKKATEVFETIREISKPISPTKQTKAKKGKGSPVVEGNFGKKK